jgi:murein DD-endopeptidase MepM/ murein hydrolase activator NlpD
LNFFNRCKKYIVIAAVSVTIGVSYVYITDNKPNAYEVCVGDKIVAYIKEDNNAIDAIRAIGEEVEKRFGSSELKSILTFNRAQVTNSFITDKSKLRNAVLTNASIEVEAYALLSDGKEIAIVGNEAEGKQVLDKLREYYLAKSGIAVKESKIKNNITYSKKKGILSKIQDVDKIVEAIIDVNSKAKKPIVSVELVGTTETKQTISPPTTITYSDDMPVGQSKVTSSGKEGQKLVVKEIVIENNKIMSSRFISEKVITAAQEKVIVKGKKTAAATSKALLASPSRGTISSNFGMRWGKMHEGMDIAAPVGQPILAALDGTVTFAGWQNGYGNFIKLKHSGGVETAYGHCSKIEVKVGESVEKGEKIGEVGSTGNSTGPHLHFEVLVNGQQKNPAGYLK